MFGIVYLLSSLCTQSRPFGTALLIGGVDERGPQLYVTLSPSPSPFSFYPQPTCTYDDPVPILCSWHLDPSGTYTRYDAKAIGSGSEGAQASLQEHYHKGITIAEAEEKLLTILKQVMEEKLNSTNVEVNAWLYYWEISCFY